MIRQYKGNYPYNQETISGWNNSQIGVYYCGYPNQDGSLTPLYVGKATGQDGIRGRLRQHISQDNWSGVTHFGYCVCDTPKEADDFEVAEISRCNPKYNTQGKSSSF